MRGIGKRLSEVRSFRAFVFEVTVVVIGVMIALGANELVSKWSWDRRVAKAESLLAVEADENRVLLVEQVMTVPCVVAQIDRIDNALRAPGTWMGTATMPTVIGPAVIRSPSRHFSDSVWQSLISDGTVAQFSTQRAQATSLYYAQQRTLQHLLGETEAVRARLDFLARPLPLSAETRATLLQDVAELRWFTLRQGMMASQMLSALRDLGRLPDASQVERDMTGMSPTSTINQCRASGLPLTPLTEIISPLFPPSTRRQP